MSRKEGFFASAAGSSASIFCRSYAVCGRFDPEIVHGLVQGLYMHVGPELQDMMRMYEFVQIEGLLGVTGS